MNNQANTESQARRANALTIDNLLPCSEGTPGLSIGKIYRADSLVGEIERWETDNGAPVWVAELIGNFDTDYFQGKSLDGLLEQVRNEINR